MSEPIVEEQSQNEDHENWKQNIPFMYEICISHQTLWPSLTIQWLNDVENLDDDTERHRLICGTMTNGEEREKILILKLSLPKNISDEVDYAKLNQTWQQENVGKVEIECEIDSVKEVNRLRQCPFNCDLIAAQEANGYFSLYDLAKQKRLIDFKGQEAEGYGIAWNPLKANNVLSASYDGKIYLWNMGRETPEAIYAYHESAAEDICWRPKDLDVFVSCSDDKTFAIADIRTSNGITIKQEAHSAEINNVQFNPFDHNLIATGSSDNTAKIFDIRRPEKDIHTFESHEAPIFALQWSPHKKNYLATGSEDCKVIIWDYYKIGAEIKAEDEKDGPAELLFFHGGHRSKINDLSWNPKNSNLIATVEEHKNILQIWKVQSSLWQEDENDDYVQQLLS